MIDIETFNKSTDFFDKIEKRTNFFTLARNLIDKGFEIEGLILILSTWNFATFRYYTKTFDIENFKLTLDAIKPNFEKLKEQTFETINLDKYKKEIETIFNSLSVIDGISYTGSPKLMHLINPNLFVMWDAYIRGEKSKKYYNQIDIYKCKKLVFKKYKKTFDGYFEFLKDMQQYKYSNLNKNKSLAKAVDECNYVNITLEIQKMEKENLKKKMKKLRNF